MNKTGTCIITGIFGSCHGVGTSHLALSLANALVSRSHRKTALVEINSSDFSNLLGENFEYREGLFHFSLLGIEIFSPTDVNIISELRSSFEEIVIDFGFKKDISHDLTLCDKVLITASFSPYRILPLNSFLRDESIIEKAAVHNIIFVTYGKNKYSINWQRKNKIPLLYIPFILDPLKIPLKDANRLVELV